MESPDFLKDKYKLQESSEVQSAVDRTESRGEKVPANPADRIQNYLNRFKEIIDRDDPEKRERGMEALKKVLYDRFVIKPEEIPDGYFENQRRIAREQGHGDIEITPEMRDQLAEVIVADQKSSLDTWIDYLSSSDVTYPDWLKYYAFRSVLSMGEYDKEKKQFTQRSNGTTKPFPDLDREALAYVLDAMEKSQGREYFRLQEEINAEKNKFKMFRGAVRAGASAEAGEEEGFRNRIDELEKKQERLVAKGNYSEEERGEFSRKVDEGDFSKLYAWAIEKVTPASQETLANVEGTWIKYDKNSDHMSLVESLQGHGTGWCTAGESTAETQLKGGDFYVYYSLDASDKPTVPRAAIRMQEGGIAEVRGIAAEQNLDPYISGVVQEKLKEFPDGKQYEKKVGDMKLLTAVERKTQKNQPLTKEDLVFLYEINAPIEGFGYERDPRIEELRAARNPEEDMPIVFECSKDQIARDISEIKEDTKAYVGKLVPGIFDAIQERNIEHIYTSFPEGKIRREVVEIGRKDAETLIKEMREKKINITANAEYMMKSKDFTTLKHSESADLVRLKVGDLGFPESKYPTTDEIYERIEELGLELCPVEVGPSYGGATVVSYRGILQHGNTHRLKKKLAL